MHQYRGGVHPVPVGHDAGHPDLAVAVALPVQPTGILVGPVHAVGVAVADRGVVVAGAAVARVLARAAVCGAGVVVVAAGLVRVVGAVRLAVADEAERRPRYLIVSKIIIQLQYKSVIALSDKAQHRLKGEF